MSFKQINILIIQLVCFVVLDAMLPFVSFSISDLHFPEALSGRGCDVYFQVPPFVVSQPEETS